MRWTSEKLHQFKILFDLKDKEIAAGVGISVTQLWKYRNGVYDPCQIGHDLSIYAGLVRDKRLIEIERSKRPFLDFQIPQTGQ